MPTTKQHYLSVTILAIFLYILTSTGAMADYEGCEYKRQQLEHQLKYSLVYNNAHRGDGLLNAFLPIKEFFTDKWLLTRKGNKVAEKQGKVTERQWKLEQARAAEKRRKIANNQTKLYETKEELAETRREIHNRLVQ